MCIVSQGVFNQSLRKMMSVTIRQDYQYDMLSTDWVDEVITNYFSNSNPF